MSGFDMAVARLRRELREKDPVLFVTNPSFVCPACGDEWKKDGTVVREVLCERCLDGD